MSSSSALAIVSFSGCLSLDQDDACKVLMRRHGHDVLVDVERDPEGSLIRVRQDVRQEVAHVAARHLTVKVSGAGFYFQTEFLYKITSGSLVPGQLV